MREILFRGKRVDNGEWIFGWYIKYSYSGWPLKATIIPSEQAENGWYEHIRVIPETIGQYIGLKDKNGTGIFEGDIVKTKYGRLCYIYWFQPKECWDLSPINTSSNLYLKSPDEWDLWYSENLEVVGNIHDNPEMMEDGE